MVSGYPRAPFIPSIYVILYVIGRYYWISSVFHLTLSPCLLWVRKIHWSRDRLPALVFLGFPCGSTGKESACNAGDLHSVPELEKSHGKGKGYPLQYSGLENSMDCIVYGVPKSCTWLSDFHSLFLTVAVYWESHCETLKCLFSFIIYNLQFMWWNCVLFLAHSLIFTHYCEQLLLCSELTIYI